MTDMRDLPPIHPGEQLCEEFMKPLGLTAYRLAKDIGVPVTRVQAIIAEQRDYALETAAEALGSRLDTEVKPRAA
jgi:antitoxin HigA-1